jgi:excisionase family DNA binding protein
MNTPAMLTTTDAAALAGVAASTIKRWADQGLLPFSRTAGGHRRFERQAVERMVREQANPSTVGASALDAWVQTLVAGRRFEAEAMLLSARGRFGRFCDVADEVGLALREIGRRWQTGALSIADEHVASDCLLRALARVGDMMPAPVDGPRCLLACAGDDEHSLGLALVELCLRERGWVSLWLGRRTPAAEIARVVGEGRVRLVALSASEALKDAAALETLAAEVGAHCQRSGVGLVLGGGGAWPAAPSYGVRLTSLTAFNDYLTRAGAR